MARNHIITGLDIGTGTIKILSVLKKSAEKDLEVLGEGRKISAGVRRGVVIDVPQVTEIISSQIKKVEADCGQKIKSVYANIGGSHIYCTSSHGLISVSRADRKISEEDIARVLQAAQSFSLPSNKEILDVFPKEFIVDGQRGVKEAVGMEGVRLEAEVLVLCGFSPYLKNSSQAILNSDLQINDLVSSPISSSRAVLTPQEKELGVLLLDIGAGTTSFAVFEEGNLIHAGIFPIGSGHITNDIAIYLKTGIDTAERIKLEFGTCVSPKQNKTKKGQVSRSSLGRGGQIKIHPSAEGERVEEEGPLVFPKKMLIEIIESRISEIFGEAQKELKKISRAGLLPAGVVLTGGGAKMPGIKALCKRELKLPCRIGFPRGFSLPQEDPSLASVCGLVLSGAELEGDQGFSFPGKGIAARLKKIFKIFIP